MQILSFLSFVAAFASATVSGDNHPPPAEIKYDETASWYKDHGVPVPHVAPAITVVEANKSYVVKLECPDCLLLFKEEDPSNLSAGLKPAHREEYNSLLLKFDIENAASFSTMRLNGARVLPLDPMPLYIKAYQVPDNLTEGAMDSIIRAGMLKPGFNGETKYAEPLPLQYEHTLLKTQHPGQWWLQFDVAGFTYDNRVGSHKFDEDRRLVQILVKEEKHVNEPGNSLVIEDIQIVERYQRAQPIKMKCGKLAMVKTVFDPAEWDEYGKLGSWSRVPYMMFGKVKYHWLDHQSNIPVLLLALVFALSFFIARAWAVRRLQERAMDAEYALLETSHDGLPPAYSDIPVIKIEEYD